MLIIAGLFTSFNLFCAPVNPLAPDTGKIIVKKSSNALDFQIDYSANDSIHFDLEHKLVYLYDSAKVDYNDIHLEADYIVIDFNNNVVSADGPRDSTGKYTGKAHFSNADQDFEATHLAYNYKTQKGKISEVTTEEGDGILHADIVKKDTGKVTYGYKGFFTTCDLDHPHYAIYAKKMKVIQDDKIITGPAYLKIADVPTPLGVPFGFFPNKKGRKSGIIIPTYGSSPTLGFFLRDGGYYWGISDKMDMAVRGDIYSKGSWGAKVYTNYRVRYKYSGNLALKYSRIITGESELPSRYARNDFFINWSHTQDAKANPSIRFSANVNAGTSSYNRNNGSRPTDYLSNTFQSNISWSKAWKFGSLSANIRHSQNTQTHNVNLSAPTLSLTINRFYPFRNSSRTHTSWYNKIGDKVSVSYASEFQNNISIGDSSLKYEWRDYVASRFKNGIRQSMPVSASFNLLHHFTITFASTMNSITQFKTINRYWNGESVITDTVNGAHISFDYNASATMTTKIYGMFHLRHTKFSVIRHTLTPALSFTYMPDFTNPKYGFYRSVQSSEFGAVTKYSIFENGIYGATPAGNLGAIGFNLMNNLEAKKRPKDNDTTATEQRVTLLDALNFAFSYNLMAKHFNWSYITGGFRLKLFKKFDVNGTFNADPYRIDANGIRIERFEWRTENRLARLTGAAVSMNTSLRKGGLSASNHYSSTRGTEQELNMINANPNAYVDFNIPWSLNIGYTLSWSKPSLISTTTQTVHFSGDMNVTPKWKVGFDSNYDIQKQKFSSASINVYRDLHCWQMQFNWIPFGVRQSYNITINVKSAMLQDLKLTRKREWFDYSTLY
ncbi:MAG: LPS-assembly protein LptD [Bacteroidetes bacterium]|nr:LPS-assembly protein LptD [Bacteroidota bacterium]